MPQLSFVFVVYLSFITLQSFAHIYYYNGNAGLGELLTMYSVHDYEYVPYILMLSSFCLFVLRLVTIRGYKLPLLVIKSKVSSNKSTSFIVLLVAVLLIIVSSYIDSRLLFIASIFVFGYEGAKSNSASKAVFILSCVLIPLTSINLLGDDYYSRFFGVPYIILAVAFFVRMKSKLSVIYAVTGFSCILNAISLRGAAEFSYISLIIPSFLFNDNILDFLLKFPSGISEINASGALFSEFKLIEFLKSIIISLSIDRSVYFEHSAYYSLNNHLNINTSNLGLPMNVPASFFYFLGYLAFIPIVIVGGLFTYVDVYIKRKLYNNKRTVLYVGTLYLMTFYVLLMSFHTGVFGMVKLYFLIILTLYIGKKKFILGKFKI